MYVRHMDAREDQTMFYEIFCRDNVYTFMFSNEGDTAAIITLADPLCKDQRVELHQGRNYETLSDAQRASIESLRCNTLRLCKEAMTMQREYMQGASGFLPCDATRGQMLFGMDTDTADDLGNY